MQQRTLGILCTLGALSLATGTVGAQTTAGALQLALGTDLINYTKTSGTIVTNPTTDVSRGTTRWGFSDRNAINIEGGYGLTDSLILGGLVSLGGWSQRTESTTNFIVGNGVSDTTDSSFDLVIAPKVDYMFLPGQRIRPFIGGAIGVLYHSAKSESRLDTGATRLDSEQSLTGLDLMARVGARFFLTPGFTIDPAFAFMWMPTASGSYQIRDTKYDMNSLNGYSVGLTLAASGWIGL
jgi:hypothetical protein